MPACASSYRVSLVEIERFDRDHHAVSVYLFALPYSFCGCRKKKAVHKPAATDDKRLQNTLKRLGVNIIPGIEEVMIMKEEGSVIHFTNPKGTELYVSL